MKTDFTKFSLFVFLMGGLLFQVSAQTVDAHYLNPKHSNSGVYSFIRFGTSSVYQAGFMYNETHATYGDGDDFSIFTYNNRDLTFTTGTGNLIVFPTSGGNMGVGTVNPSSKLHVTGRGRFGYGPIFLDWTHETNWGGSSTKWAGYIGFNAYRSNDDTKDHFFGENRYTSKGVIEGSNSGFRFLYRNQVGYDSDNQHLLPELMRLASNGNLGIGTTSPATKLHVAGNATVIGDIIIDYGKSLRVDTDWSGNGETKILKTGWESGRDDYLDFYVPGNGSVNQTARMSLLQNGSVGIGTTTPTEKLEVNGTIRSREVKVETANWPDYVFDPNYKLRSLEEIEEFIESNNHLPDVPSAAEVEENGIAVGEMSATLLKKIEELTLHTIEQQKQLEEQRKMIESLLEKSKK